MKFSLERNSFFSLLNQNNTNKIYQERSRNHNTLINCNPKGHKPAITRRIFDYEELKQNFKVFFVLRKIEGGTSQLSCGSIALSGPFPAAKYILETLHPLLRNSL
jgi:hypothetical protein